MGFERASMNDMPQRRRGARRSIAIVVVCVAAAIVAVIARHWGGSRAGVVGPPSNSIHVTSSAEGRTTSRPGVAPSAHLSTRTGDYVVDTAGAVVQNLHITGDLVINAPAANVTISNVKVDGVININTDTPSAAQGNTRVGIVPTGVALRHVDAHGLYAEGFNGLTVDASHFHDIQGTLSQLSRYHTVWNGYTLDWPATNLTITNTVFDRLLAVPANSGYHLEDLHLMGVQGITLRNNVFDATAPDQATASHITAALTMEPSWEGVVNSDAVIDGNSFYGGGYYQLSIHLADTNIRSQITNNAFHTYTAPDGGSGGIAYPETAPDAVFYEAGNTLDGAPYTLPYGTTH